MDGMMRYKARTKVLNKLTTKLMLSNPIARGFHVWQSKVHILQEKEKHQRIVHVNQGMMIMTGVFKKKEVCVVHSRFSRWRHVTIMETSAVNINALRYAHILRRFNVMFSKLLDVLK